MPISIPPPAGQEAANPNEWLHGFVEVAKACLIFAGGYYAHILKSRGARASRKRVFLSDIKAWRHEIDRLHPCRDSCGWQRHPMVFMDGISGFIANTEMIAGDFTAGSRMQFEDLVAVVPKCNPHDTDKILKALDDVIYYVKNAA
jgi:hypothetical protein